MTTIPRTAAARSTTFARAATALIGLLATLATVTATLDPAEAATTASPATSAKTYLSKADAALVTTLTQVESGHPVRAVRALERLRTNLRAAHRFADRLIGEPPTDPESDEPPGPSAVLSVMRLDHRVATRLVPLYDHLTGSLVHDALTASLSVTYRRRDATLSRVVVLPAEGAGDDYTDGMSDTLNQYSSEVEQLAAALSSYALSAEARTALSQFLETVLNTQSVMESTYGGGE